MLTITRASDSAGLLRRILIQVDNETVARLRPNRTETVALGPGPHVVQARMDWCSSPPVTINADGHIGVAYPLKSITKLFRDTGNAIKISVRTRRIRFSPRALIDGSD
jgi:hypothetical protein